MNYNSVICLVPIKLVFDFFVEYIIVKENYKIHKLA